ncbi:flagellar hook-basal body complex protein FliE [Salirhabdus euzebyi]|uniref:Flagellar hook-basal body complex protein FliE n=1 Tax=Salirhabdus euzebyi TaxID=394506 RepID=A0A841Q3G7_9BACI|nr:flagellar hook-basal body complex protein FliE [Salirhabdus euzebyi]MBB6452928.1 flagellar hook-basal body complex protein FliE [Salirhabdus euzebyi]
MTSINPIAFNQPIQQANPVKKVTPFEAQQNFAAQLKNALEKVNEAQAISDQKTVALAQGKNVDLHDVMIASQKSSIMLQTTVEVQSKAIEAYKEVMRMQI